MTPEVRLLAKPVWVTCAALAYGLLHAGVPVAHGLLVGEA